MIFLGQAAYGQQEPMFTKYMFNSLIFNPAYAGSKNHMTLGLLHRTQWFGIEGAPTTQTFTAHTPLRNERVAVGMSLINDEIGPTQTIGANLIYTYRIPLGEKFKLSVGLQGGLESYKANWTGLNIENTGDQAFADNQSEMLPNFGGGIYLASDHFYIGAASPHLLEHDLRKGAITEIYARQVRHYYFMTGAAIPVNGDALIFKPSILIKNVGLFKSQSKLDSFNDIGAPNEFDVDISFLFQQTLWVGGSFRSTWNSASSPDSADFWFSYLLKNGFRFGAAYDIPISDLNKVTNGSIEIMLGYEFNFEEKKVVTPRYF